MEKAWLAGPTILQALNMSWCTVQFIISKWKEYTKTVNLSRHGCRLKMIDRAKRINQQSRQEAHRNSGEATETHSSGGRIRR